tara:strand:- start:1306 stop:1605 length:300 start_codon:yes stop_codon:yes gene_type:complete
MAEEVQKKLLIKKNIFKRLQKECEFYKDEIKQLQIVIENMEIHDPTNYDINKKKEMLDESKNTLKVVNVKVSDAQKELFEFIEQHLEDGTINNELISDL